MEEDSDVHVTHLKLGANINTVDVLGRSALLAGDKSPQRCNCQGPPCRVIPLGIRVGNKIVKKKSCDLVKTFGTNIIGVISSTERKGWMGEIDGEGVAVME